MECVSMATYFLFFANFLVFVSIVWISFYEIKYSYLEIIIDFTLCTVKVLAVAVFSCSIWILHDKPGFFHIMEKASEVVLQKVPSEDDPKVRTLVPEKSVQYVAQFLASADLNCACARFCYSVSPWVTFQKFWNIKWIKICVYCYFNIFMLRRRILQRKRKFRRPLSSMWNTSAAEVGTGRPHRRHRGECVTFG